jgi:hypothetical protein
LFQWHGYQNKEKISKRSNDNIWKNNVNLVEMTTLLTSVPWTEKAGRGKLDYITSSNRL